MGSDPVPVRWTCPGTPPPATLGSGGLKRKRELGECRRETLDLPETSGRVELRGRGTAPDGPVSAGVLAPRLRVKSESPSYSPVPGEDSVATGYSGEEDDDGGTYFCPGWAIKHRPPIWFTPAPTGATI